MGFAVVTGIPPLLASGFPWVKITGKFRTSSDWGDGTGRSPEEIPVELAATGLSLVVKGTQQPVKVPAIPTGGGQLVSPPVSFSLTATDGAGNEVPFAMTPRVLNADGSNNWHINSQNSNVTYADNAGPAPVGLTQAAGDLRYAQLTLLATTVQHGLVRFANAAEGLGNASDRALTPIGVYTAEWYSTTRTASSLPNDFKIGRSYCHSPSSDPNNPTANGCLIETLRYGFDGTWGDHQRAMDKDGAMYSRVQNGVLNAWSAWQKLTP